MPPDTSAADPLVNYRLEMIEKSIATMSENLLKLTTLEQKYQSGQDAMFRVFTSIEKHDTRITAIESELPTLKLARGWVIGGVIGIVCMNGGMLALALKFFAPHAG